MLSTGPGSFGKASGLYFPKTKGSHILLFPLKAQASYLLGFLCRHCQVITSHRSRGTNSAYLCVYSFTLTLLFFGIVEAFPLAKATSCCCRISGLWEKGRQLFEELGKGPEMTPRGTEKTLACDTVGSVTTPSLSSLSLVSVWAFTMIGLSLQWRNRSSSSGNQTLSYLLSSSLRNLC